MGIFRNQKERATALKGVSIFGSLPMKDMLALQKHCDEATVVDGTVFAHQDSVPKQMVILVAGSASVTRNGKKIAMLGPGDTIGELSLIDGGRQTATVTAKGECDVLVVPVNEFAAFMDDAPGFSRKLLRSLAGRLRAADELLAP